jgi:hypothetical protein
VIANAKPTLNATAGTIAYFAVNAWMLSSFGGLGRSAKPVSRLMRPAVDEEGSSNGNSNGPYSSFLFHCYS